MSAHSKGPWIAKFGLAGRGERSIYATAFDGSQRYVCDRVRGGSPQEAEANARLIAAAPELLEAVKALYETLTLSPLEAAAKYGPDYDQREADKYAAELAEKAIAKAKGRS